MKEEARTGEVAPEAGRGDASGRGRIDVHQHFVPDIYRDALAGIGIDSVGRVPLPAWSESGMFEGMARLGIGRSLLSISAPGVYFGDQPLATSLARRTNDALAELKARHPARLGGLATLPLPGVDEALEEWRRVRDEGLDGVILLTNYGGKYLGHPDFEPLLEALSEARAVVLLHPTLPPGLELIDMPLPPPILEFVFDTTRTLADMIFSGVLDRHPGINWIVAHMGGTLPFVAGRLSMIEYSERGAYAAFRERGRSVMSYLQSFYYDSAVSCAPSSLSALLEIVGPDRIVYGSDLPFLPTRFAEQNRTWLEEHPGLDQPGLAAIAAGNMERLLAPA